MAYDRWRLPHETVDNGQACFVPLGDDDRGLPVLVEEQDAQTADTVNTQNKSRTKKFPSAPPLKMDYIYVAKPTKSKEKLQPGYYHMRTEEAHNEVYRRFLALPKPSRRPKQASKQQQQRGRTKSKSIDDDDDTQSIRTTTTSIFRPDEDEESIVLEADNSDKKSSNAESDYHINELYYYKEAKRILYNRTWTEEPDDVLAQRMALLNSQSQGSATKKWTHATYMPVIVGSVLVSLGGR